MKAGDHRKDCCKPENGNLGPVQKYEGRDDLTFQRCAVCGCRHFEAVVDPGKFEFRGKALA